MDFKLQTHADKVREGWGWGGGLHVYKNEHSHSSH